MDEYPERFYTRFGALFGWFALVAGPIWAAVLVAPSPRLWDAPLIFGLVALLLILCVICAALVVAAYPVRIGPTGIRSYDMVGRYYSVPWDEILSVEPRKYVGFPFLRIESKGGRIVYVTTWIRKADCFLKRVRELGGPENPLARALDNGRGKI